MIIDAIRNNLHVKSHLHPCAKAYGVFFHRKLPSPARDTRPGSLARHRNTTPSGSEAPPRLLPPSKTPQTSGAVGTVVVGSSNPLRLWRSLRAVCRHRRRVQRPDVRLQRDACPLAVQCSFLDEVETTSSQAGGGEPVMRIGGGGHGCLARIFCRRADRCGRGWPARGWTATRASRGRSNDKHGNALSSDQ